MNNIVIKNLVFFTEGGKTYFGVSRAGQFIEYQLKCGSSAYGYGAHNVLTVNHEVLQDSPDDIHVDQQKLVAKLIEGLLEKEVKELTFYSHLYKKSVKFERGDDIFDIVDKLKKLAVNYGDGKIY